MARLQDVIGYGTHAARPPAGSAGALYYETDTQILFRDNGASWDALTIAPSGPTSKVLLDYTPPGDLNNGGAISATTWTDLIPNQSFTVDAADHLVEFSVRGNARITPNSAGEIASRLIIDSGTSPIIKGLGGDTVSTYGNALAGAGTVAISGLSAGAHTVKLQVYSQAAGTIYSRSTSQADIEPLGLVVIERVA